MTDLINKIVLHICYRCGEDEDMRGIKHDCDGCLLSEVIDEIKSINDRPHGRLIDADALLKRINGTASRKVISLDNLFFIINDTPSADAVSREEYNELLRTKISFANATIPTSADAEWIPCSERLPSEHEDVIVTVCDDSADSIWEYTTTAWRIGGIWISDNAPVIGNVVAWMPLPKPYREDGEA